MGNLQDYLHWRGDLVLADHPFNVVDNLVLCALAYLDLDGVVPGVDSAASVTVEAASELLRRQPPTRYDPRRLVVVKPSVLHGMATTARFRNARLSRYVDHTDPGTGTQFAAVTVHLDDGTVYVAYRGTDTSIVGWKEDFVMSFERMPSHGLAADYLLAVVGSTASGTERNVRVGGHSKGGNLAVSATLALAQVDQDRIAVVYDNDGPGVRPEDAASVRQLPLSDRIVRVVPEFAVVGMLFHPGPPDTIVRSSGRGIMQHDIMTWQIRGAELDRGTELASGAAAINRALAEWLAEVPPADRRRMTDSLFGALAAGGATLLQDVGRRDFGSVESILLSLARSRGHLRRPFRRGVRTITSSFATVDYLALFRQFRSVRSALLSMLGLFFIVVPGLAVQVLAALAVACLCAMVGTRLARYFLKFRRDHELSWLQLIPATLLLSGIVVATTQIGAFVVPEDILLGVSFLMGGWASARSGLAAFRVRPHRRSRTTLYSINAVIATLFGIVALSTVARVQPFFIQQAGHYCFIVGLVGLFLIVRDQAAAEYRRNETLQA